jgi:hypothetical protein
MAAPAEERPGAALSRHASPHTIPRAAGSQRRRRDKTTRRETVQVAQEARIHIAARERTRVSPSRQRPANAIARQALLRCPPARRQTCSRQNDARQSPGADAENMIRAFSGAPRCRGVARCRRHHAATRQAQYNHRAATQPSRSSTARAGATHSARFVLPYPQPRAARLHPAVVAAWNAANVHVQATRSR